MEEKQPQTPTEPSSALDNDVNSTSVPDAGNYIEVNKIASELQEIEKMETKPPSTARIQSKSNKQGSNPRAQVVIAKPRTERVPRRSDSEDFSYTI